MAAASDANGYWQKLFMALLSAVFVVLAGAYAKLALDVSTTSKDTSTNTSEISVIKTEITTIRKRLDNMDNADEVDATAERDRLQVQVEELQRRAN